jgi:hypothetical protein
MSKPKYGAWVLTALIRVTTVLFIIANLNIFHNRFVMNFNFFPIPQDIYKEFNSNVADRLFSYWLATKLLLYPHYSTVTKKKIKILLEPLEFVFGRSESSKEALISEKEMRNRIDKLKKLGYCKEIESKNRPEFKIYCLTLPEKKGQPESHGESIKKGQPDYEKGQPEGQPKGQPDEIEKTHSYIRENQSYYKENIIKGPARGPAKGPHSKEAKESEESLSFRKSDSDSPPFQGKEKSPFFRLNEKSFEISAVDIENIQDFSEKNGFSIEYKTVKIWLHKYDFAYIINHIELMISRSKKNKIGHYEKWMEEALKKDYARENRNKKINRKYAEEFKMINCWTDLKIQQRGAVNIKNQTDFSYSLNHGKFVELLEKDYLKE